MIVVGSMIGSGIFIVSAESSRLIGAPGFLLLTWIIAGVLTITGALCCAELAAMMPRAGGPYVFLREAYGPSTGFLYGWAVFVVIQTGTIAAVAVAFAKFLGVLAPAIATENYLIAPIRIGSGYAISLSTEQLVAIALILLLTWTNTRGLEIGKFVQNIFTLAKTAALLALIVIGLSLGWKSDCAALSADWWNPSANGWSPQVAQPGLTIVGGLALVVLFGKAMVGPLFAQTAWTNVTFIGSEVRDPGRNLPRSARRLRDRRDALRPREPRLRGDALVSRNSTRSAKSRRRRRDEFRSWRAGHARDGGRDHDFHLRLQQRSHPRRRACVLRDGARRAVFSRRIEDNKHHVPAIALVTQGMWTAFLTFRAR